MNTGVEIPHFDPIVLTPATETVDYVKLQLPVWMQDRDRWHAVLIQSDPAVIRLYTAYNIDVGENRSIRRRVFLHLLLPAASDFRKLLGNGFSASGYSWEVVPDHRHEWPIVGQVQDGSLISHKGFGTLDDPPDEIEPHILQPGQYHSLVGRNAYHRIELLTDQVLTLIIAGGRFDQNPPNYRPSYLALPERARDMLLERHMGFYTL